MCAQKRDHPDGTKNHQVSLQFVTSSSRMSNGGS
jgi:hypothetical protein